MPNDDTKKKPLFDLTKLQIADDFDDGLRGQKVYDIIRCDKPQPNEWFKLFDLGEGNAELTIIFKDSDDETWSTFDSILRSPEVVAEGGAGVPQWALSLAWIGAGVTFILTILGGLVLRRDRLT